MLDMADSVLFDWAHDEPGAKASKITVLPLR
jgi:hypothetical protein